VTFQVDPKVREVFRLMGPAVLGAAAVQVNVVLINSNFAGHLGDRPISWLNYAFRIMYLPIGLFGVSIGTAVLPTVSRHAAQRNATAARETIADGLSLMMMLNVPATVGLLVLAAPIVRLLFERRAFTPLDTAATAAAVQLYAIGLVGYSIVRITSPTFYALGKNRIPVQVSVLTVIVNASLNIGLQRLFGFKGLALGTSLAALFNAVTLLVLLRRELHGLGGNRLARAFGRISIAAAVMGLAAFFAERELGLLIPGAGLVVQGREGQFRPCRLEPSGLATASEWLEYHRHEYEERMDRLATYLRELQDAGESPTGAATRSPEPITAPKRSTDGRSDRARRPRRT
jgi:putative peptidoglycan lipid II flippase